MVKSAAKTVAVVSVAAAVLGGSFLLMRSRATSGNLLVNARFDSGALSPWRVAQTSGQTCGSGVLDTVVFRSPPASLKVITCATDLVQVTQPIPVVPGGTYQLIGYIKGTGIASSSNFGGAYIQLYESATNKNQSALIRGTTGFTEVIARLKVQSATHLTAGCNFGQSSGTANFDDLFATRVA